MLAEMVATIVAGLATWKLSKLLREKAFFFAACGMALALLLLGLLLMLYAAWSWIPYGFQVRLGDAYILTSRLQVIPFFAFIVIFAIGAVRCGMHARKTAS